MRVLICGDRFWTKKKPILRELSALENVECVIEGEAPGADTISRLCAGELKIPVKKFPANWHKFGRAAGPIRNAQMLKKGNPDLVLAFHNDIENSKGTKDMVTRAKKAGIPVKVFKK